MNNSHKIFFLITISLPANCSNQAKDSDLRTRVRNIDPEATASTESLEPVAQIQVTPEVGSATPKDLGPPAPENAYLRDFLPAYGKYCAGCHSNQTLTDLSTESKVRTHILMNCLLKRTANCLLDRLSETTIQPMPPGTPTNPEWATDSAAMLAWITEAMAAIQTDNAAAEAAVADPDIEVNAPTDPSIPMDTSAWAVVVKPVFDVSCKICHANDLDSEVKWTTNIHTYCGATDQSRCLRARLLGTVGAIMPPVFATAQNQALTAVKRDRVLAWINSQLSDDSSPFEGVISNAAASDPHKILFSGKLLSRNATRIFSYIDPKTGTFVETTVSLSDSVFGGFSLGYGGINRPESLSQERMRVLRSTIYPRCVTLYTRENSWLAGNVVATRFLVHRTGRPTVDDIDQFIRWVSGANPKGSYHVGASEYALAVEKLGSTVPVKDVYSHLCLAIMTGWMSLAR